MIKEERPLLSVLIVTRNESKYIANLLHALINQTLEKSEYEIIVVDGKSDDGTLEIVDDIQKRTPSLVKRYVNNQKFLPAGWNIAIKNSNGKYIIRVDGHTIINNEFLSAYKDLIERQNKIECVGGVILSKGTSFQGTVNQYVYSHSFGVGNSKFRTTKGVWEGFVDTVPYGAYKREVFEKVGYFNEDLKRNEDIEFHKRMKDQGMRFFMSTSIQSTYYVRPTLKGLIQKSLGDGTWTMIADQSVPGSLRTRHKAPLFAFLIGLAVLLLAVFFTPMRWVLGGVGLLYLAAASWASLGIIKQSGIRYFLPTIWTFFCLHFFRGLGCFMAFFKKEYWFFKKKRNSLRSDKPIK